MNFVLIAVIITNVIFNAAVCGNELKIEDILGWLVQYSNRATTRHLSVTTTTTTVPPQRPQTGGLLCGLNKYTEHDATKPPVYPYKGQARHNEAPWLVRIIDGETYAWFCDGVIVSSRSILTAASCIEPKKRYLVVMGDHTFGKMDEGETTISIARTFYHPNYESVTKRFDFAILFTENSIPMDKAAIRPICLPAAGDAHDHAGAQLSVFGWAQGGPTRQPHLQKESSLNFIKAFADCSKSYSLETTAITPNLTICVGSGSGDVCNADIGSPLVEYKNGRHFLVGIASTSGHGCKPAKPKYLPAVFGRVSQILPWILGIANSPVVPEVTPPPRPPLPSFTNRPLPPLPPIASRVTTSTTTTPSSNKVYDLSMPDCGINKYMDAAKKVTLRIIGGSEAKNHQVPWQVRILVKGYLCGGTIINRRIVLTAAHCISSRMAALYRVIAGDHSTVSMDAGEQVLEVAKVIVHEGYDEASDLNDFALLITAKDIPFTTWSIRPVCLPSSTKENYVGWNATISGWGRINPSTQHVPEALKITSVVVQGNEKCVQAYKPKHWLDPGVAITDEMLCAAAPGQDTCQGDSGGPLTVLENGKHTLVGVTSFGKSCGDERYPGVYARVTSILEWLEKQMTKHLAKIK